MVAEMSDLQKTLLANARAKALEAAQSGDPLDKEGVIRMVEAMLSEQVASGRKTKFGSTPEAPEIQLGGNSVVRSGQYAGAQSRHIILADYLLRKTNAQAPQPKTLKYSPAFQKALYDAWDQECRGMFTSEEKALDSTTATAGDELVPLLMSNSLWDDVHLETQIAREIQTQPMPSNPFDLPYQFGDITWRKGTANTATTATDLATGKTTITAFEVVGEVDWSYDLDEEAVVAVMPNVEETIRRNAAQGIDEVILNADTTTGTTNINNNGGAISADSRFLLGFDGIIHQALIDNTAMATDGAGALTSTLVKNLISSLGKYGIPSPRSCMFVADVYTFASMLTLDEIVTVDKAGPGAATILNGAPASLFGIQVIPSGQMSKAHTDGQVSSTGANNTKGRLVLTNKSQWLKGFVRELMIEVWRDIKKRQVVLVPSWKLGLVTRGTRSSNIHTGIVYNLTF